MHLFHILFAYPTVPTQKLHAKLLEECITALAHQQMNVTMISLC